MRRLVYLVPAAFLVLLGVLFWQVLDVRKHESPTALPSPLVGKPAPEVPLAALDAQAQAFTRADLGQGKPVIINFWASWCAPCRIEAPVLNDLAERGDVPIYGIVYKDDPGKARAFLDELGNPFAKINNDPDGRAGIDWGVTGFPETFVIDGKGIIRAHYAGPLTDDVVRELILPAAQP